MSRRPAIPWKQLATAGTLAVFLAVCAIKVAGELVAGYYWNAAARKLGDSLPVSQAEWTSAMLLLQESLRYSPRYVWSLELIGEQQLARMRPGTLGDGPASESPAVAALLANTNLHHALVERPTSAYAWANIAVSKLRLRQVDAALKAALRHADELGPWEADIQQRVLGVSLAIWDRLDAQERAATRRTLERALHRDEPRTMALLRAAGMLDLLEPP